MDRGGHPDLARRRPHGRRPPRGARRLRVSGVELALRRRIHFRGTYVRGKARGEGELRDADGSLYRGGFVRGEREGQGSITYANGARYTGDWKRDEWEGQGHLDFADGGRYDGALTYSKRNGHGVLRSSDGSLREGDGVEDELEGQGRMTLRDGSTYVGHSTLLSRRVTATGGQLVVVPDPIGAGKSAKGGFKRGKPDGSWTVTDRDGQSVTVEFENGGAMRGSPPMKVAPPLTPRIEAAA